MKTSRQDNARTNLSKEDVDFLHTAAVRRKGSISLMRQYLQENSNLRFLSDTSLRRTFEHYYGETPKQHYVACREKGR